MVGELMRKKDIVTLVCLCGSEWDLKSPVVLLDTRIVAPIPSLSYTTSVSVAEPLKPKPKASKT